jgi:hypothetical protein
MSLVPGCAMRWWLELQARRCPRAVPWLHDPSLARARSLLQLRPLPPPSTLCRWDTDQVSHGANMNRASDNGTTPLYAARVCDHHLTAELLLELGADPMKVRTLTTHAVAGPIVADACQASCIGSALWMYRVSKREAHVTM